MTSKADIGIWYPVQAEDDRITGTVTEAMNVSGGCIVRTRTENGSVAQTLLLNMRCVKTGTDELSCTYKLEPGVIVP